MDDEDWPTSGSTNGDIAAVAAAGNETLLAEPILSPFSLLPFSSETALVDPELETLNFNQSPQALFDGDIGREYQTAPLELRVDDSRWSPLSFGQTPVPTQFSPPLGSSNQANPEADPWNGEHVLSAYFQGLIDASTASSNQPERAQLPTSNKRQKKVNQGFYCHANDCNAVFNRACDLRKHTQRKHLAENARPLGCPFCDKRFCDRKDLNRHTTSRHRDQTPGTEGEGSSNPLKRRCSRDLSENLGTVLLSDIMTPRTPSRNSHAIDSSAAVREKPAADLELIHGQSIQVFDSGAPKLAKLDISALENSFAECCIKDHTTGSDYSAVPDQGELYAIEGLAIIVAPKRLALDLSSDFNPNSSFKLRSLKIPKQRRKLEQKIAQRYRTHDSEIMKVVLLNSSRRRCYVLDLSGKRCLVDLFSFLCGSINVPFRPGSLQTLNIRGVGDRALIENVIMMQVLADAFMQASYVPEWVLWEGCSIFRPEVTLWSAMLSFFIERNT